MVRDPTVVGFGSVPHLDRKLLQTSLISNLYYNTVKHKLRDLRPRNFENIFLILGSEEAHRPRLLDSTVWYFGLFYLILVWSVTGDRFSEVSGDTRVTLQHRRLVAP